MIVGINAGFGEPVGKAMLAELWSIGWQSYRQQLLKPTGPQRAIGNGTNSAAQIQELIREGESSGLIPLYIATPGLLHFLPPSTWFNFYNEVNLSRWSPSRYVSMLIGSMRPIEELNLQPFVGGISNLGVKELEWLAALVPKLPARFGIDIHRYPPKGQDPRAPQAGHRSRDEEMARFLRIVGNRPWIVSEFGYHVAPEKTGPWWRRRTRRLTGYEQADRIVYDYKLYARYGAKAAYVYQLNDGETDDKGGRFGMRDQHGWFRPIRHEIASQVIGAV